MELLTAGHVIAAGQTLLFCQLCNKQHCDGNSERGKDRKNIDSERGRTPVSHLLALQTGHPTTRRQNHWERHTNSALHPCARSILFPLCDAAMCLTPFFTRCHSCLRVPSFQASNGFGKRQEALCSSSLISSERASAASKLAFNSNTIYSVHSS